MTKLFVTRHVLCSSVGSVVYDMWLCCCPAVRIGPQCCSSHTSRFATVCTVGAGSLLLSGRDEVLDAEATWRDMKPTHPPAHRST